MDGPGLYAVTSGSANAHAALLQFNDTVGRLLCHATCCCSRSRCTVAYLVGCACKSNRGYGVITRCRVVTPSPAQRDAPPRKPNNTSAVATPTFAQAASSQAGLLRSLVASCRINASSISDVPRAPFNI